MFTNSANRENSNAEKYQARLKKFGREDILPLWVADMEIDTPSFVVNALKKRLEHPIFGYETMPDSAFEAQIAWMKRHHDILLKRENMFFSPSVLTSLNLAIQAFSQIGDEIIIQPPVYPAFASSILNNQRVVAENPLKVKDSDYTFDLEDLKKKITPKTKLLLLCSPHNPVGRVWKKEELLELSSICLEHNIIVVADEIHCDLAFKKHTPFALLYQQTITLLSPAKSFNLSGMAISTIALHNEELKKRFEQHYKAVHLGEGNTLAHIAFEVAYSKGEVWLSALKKHLQNNIEELNKLLNTPSSPIKFKKPEATFLLWLDCRGLSLDDEALANYFIECGLGLNKGSDFGLGGSGYMRLNIGVSKDIFEQLLLKFKY